MSLHTKPNGSHLNLNLSSCHPPKTEEFLKNKTLESDESVLLMKYLKNRAESKYSLCNRCYKAHTVQWTCRSTINDIVKKDRETFYSTKKNKNRIPLVTTYKSLCPKKPITTSLDIICLLLTLSKERLTFSSTNSCI